MGSGDMKQNEEYQTSACCAVFPLCLGRSSLAPVSLKAPLPNTKPALIGQHKHA